MTDKIVTHKFEHFAPALTFLQEQTRAGLHAIYFPRGGDVPRKIASEPSQHFVIILVEEDPK
jgi:hypothetical protein